jgi:hypothetical protein
MHPSSYPIDLINEVQDETFDIGKGVYALADADDSLDDLSFLDGRFIINSRLRRTATRARTTSGGDSYIDFNPAVWYAIKDQEGEEGTVRNFYATCSRALEYLKVRCFS